MVVDDPREHRRPLEYVVVAFSRYGGQRFREPRWALRGRRRQFIIVLNGSLFSTLPGNQRLGWQLHCRPRELRRERGWQCNCRPNR